MLLVFCIFSSEIKFHIKSLGKFLVKKPKQISKAAYFRLLPYLFFLETRVFHRNKSMGFTKNVLVCVPELYLPLVEIGSYDNILEWKRRIMKLSSVLLLLTDVQMFSTKA